MIDVTITGEDRLNLRLQKIADAKWFDSFIRDLSQSVYDDVEKGYNRHSKTGLLEKSLGSGVEKIGDRAFRVRSDGQIANYNIWLEVGSRPHEIKPVKRKALRWVVGNQFAFAKFVKHPGYVGDPIFTMAATHALREFDTLVHKYLAEI